MYKYIIKKFKRLVDLFKIYLEMALLNTHHYDGKLKAEISKFKDLNKIGEISLEEKKEVFLAIHQWLSPRNPEATRMLQLIIDNTNDHKQKSSNFDPSNDYWADDLLYMCWEMRKKIQQDGDDEDKELFDSVFTLQLEDIKGGTCAQGRTARLFQVISSFTDNTSSEENEISSEEDEISEDKSDESSFSEDELLDKFKTFLNRNS